jgi:hypothetical protein
MRRGQWIVTKKFAAAILLALPVLAGEFTTYK